MSKKPNLLVKDNLVRHLSQKVKRLEEISDISSSCGDPLILDSLLATVMSYFEAALLDTVREYAYAKPDEICELMLDQIDKRAFDKEGIKEKGFEDYLVDTYLDKVAFFSIKGKIGEIENLSGITVDLGNERWECILEAIARRNCFIHNDLIANNTYFKQAGQKAVGVAHGKKIEVTDSYLNDAIQCIQSLLDEIKTSLEKAFHDRSSIAAVKELWNFLFENHYPLVFEDCWDTTGNLITYKGPTLKILMDSVSPRTVCLFTAWMSFFNSATYRDLKFFPDIFFNSSEGREIYSKKLKYLMNSFEKIDFEGFGVQVYEKGWRYD